MSQLQDNPAKGTGKPAQNMEGQQPHFDKMADKVGTAVVTTVLVQSGRGVIRTLVKNPLFMFGLGMMTGYLAHKYRKEIIVLSRKTADQGKDFMRRQSVSLKNLLNAETSLPESPDAE